MMLNYSHKGDIGGTINGHANNENQVNGGGGNKRMANRQSQAPAAIPQTSRNTMAPSDIYNTHNNNNNNINANNNNNNNNHSESQEQKNKKEASYRTAEGNFFSSFFFLINQRPNKNYSKKVKLKIF